MIGRAINHRITIEASSNMGFVVQIGCGTFVYPDVPSMEAGLHKFLADPKGCESEYNKIQGSVPQDVCRDEQMDCAPTGSTTALRR